MPINISTDIAVTTGGKLSDITAIQGGWQSVETAQDMFDLTGSATLKGKLTNGQIFYVVDESEAYQLTIGGSFPFLTYTFDTFDFPGAGGGGGSDLSDLNSFSASILTYTGSTDTRIDAIESFTASILTYTGSTDTRLDALETFTGSGFATLGANTFTGSQTITDILILGSQSVEPTAVDGGIYFDTNYNLYIGQ